MMVSVIKDWLEQYESAVLLGDTCLVDALYMRIVSAMHDAAVVQAVAHSNIVMDRDRMVLYTQVGSLPIYLY